MPFKKGQSGNPKGRPKKELALTEAINTALKKKDVKRGYETLSRKQAIAEVLTQEALKGNLTAINIILDRTEGKPLQKVESKVEASIIPKIFFEGDYEEDYLDAPETPLLIDENKEQI
jgi:hypothetical protein